MTRAPAPLRPRVAAAVLLAACGVAACGGREPAAPEPEELPNRPLEAYAQQGLITGPDEFAAVAGFATLAGPADSTWVLFGMSLPTDALRFHREGEAFAAGYRVALRFEREGVERVRRDRSAQVRVATFEETGRTDEALFFQDQVLLEPGTWVVAVEVEDSIGTRGLTVTDTLDVPAYRPGEAALLMVHESRARDRLDTAPRVILNSRRVAAYGGDAPRLHVEDYGARDTIVIVVRDAAGAELTALTVPLEAAADSSPLRSATVALPVDSLPLGLLSIDVRGNAPGRAQPLLVTISDQWMVANYEEVLDYLVYIATRDEIDSLRAASSAGERRRLWDAFWARRDPVPASQVNEYREEFFERVRIAAEQFAETGRPGWRTDRGEVFIVLGAPDRSRNGELNRSDIPRAFDAVEWTYERAAGVRLQLTFVDRDGFGRFEMTRSSEIAFRTIADRLRIPHHD